MPRRAYVAGRGFTAKEHCTVECAGSVCSTTDCNDSGAETVWPSTAFQFADQYTSGESYAWFGVASDWGFVGPGRTQEDKDALTGTTLFEYWPSYDRPRPQWWSFIGRWNPDYGVDDLGRSVSWGRGDGVNTFVLSSVVAVVNLQVVLGSHSVDGTTRTEPVPGILVWHTGLYRASPVYLSYATEEDALYPDKYRHFTGSNGGVTAWSTDEAYDSGAE
ncbi:MAG: hypothetical protein PHU25_16050 [Deltaproteobacteria bacterium]|nr:hypothetical protein [Deltaproteobacteria bacterium]